MLGVFLEEADVARCASLRRVICSGEGLPRAMQDRFFERLGHCELHNLYGPTEASIDVSAWACRRDDPHAEVPIGRPIWNTRLYVVDPEGAPTPIGVLGELCIAGVGLARGYWRRPDLTAERFVPDPFSGQPGARMYRTGDLACWLPDGNLEVRGRLDYQVKIRGFRIELGEIEHAIAALESVREVVVVAREDTPGDKRLVAYVVPTQAPGPSTAALRSALKESLPEYMVPSAFVELSALPLTPNGKVDRKALPAPEVAVEASASYAAPRNTVEEQLCALFAAVLGVPVVGIHDDFFALGGHSLMAMRLVSRIGTTFGTEISPMVLFEAPTVAAFSHALGTSAEGGDGAVVMLRGGDPVVAPLVLIHPMSGDLFCYAAISRAMTRRRVFGVRSPFVTGAAPAWSTVEEMADDYARRLLERFAVGQLLIGGWSAAGVFALEVAHAIERIAPGRLDGVVLLDTHDGAPAITRPDLWLAVELLTTRGRDDLVSRAVSCEPGEIASLLREALGLDPEMWHRYASSYAAHASLVEGRRPAAPLAPVLAFRAEETNGLSRVLPNVRGVDIACTHFGILAAAAAVEVASMIERRFSAA